MKTLIMTVGLPQSGKSTWAKKQSYPIVNPDSIRLALYGKPFIKEAELLVWAITKIMVKALFIAGHGIVILDATNTTVKRRDMWDGYPEWIRNYQVFGGPEMRDECKLRARNSIEDKPHLAGIYEAIDRMADNWEPI